VKARDALIIGIEIGLIIGLIGGAQFAILKVNQSVDFMISEVEKIREETSSGLIRFNGRVDALITDLTSMWSIKGDEFHGVASWYGADFEGKFTASGEIFSLSALTAAHRSLPFGTLCKVENMRSGHSVIVKINDRGPFVDDRMIDLSPEAASRIGLLRDGLYPVKITILKQGARRRVNREK